MTKPATLRLTVLDTLRRGPVVIVVDGSHPKHVGLPARVQNQALLVAVADPCDPVVDLRQEDVFRLRYLEDGDLREATIAWTGVFAMTGTNMSGVLGGIVGAPVPAWFGQPQEQKAREFLEQLCSPEIFSGRNIAPVPVCGLRVPPEPTKLEAVQRCQHLGKAFVIVDLRKMRTDRVPLALRDRTITLLAIAWPGLDTATQVSKNSLAVLVRDHRLGPTQIELPWHAVLAVVSDWGWPRAYTWPDDYPEELLTWTMHTRAKVQEKQPPGHEPMLLIDKATAIGCMVNAQGEWGVGVSVPIGAPNTDGQRSRFSVILPPDLPTLQ